MKEIRLESLSNIPSMIAEGCLLTAGSIDNFNTMTIGWGHLGVIWRKNVFICYVKQVRYTFKFMENSDFFTISFYDPKYKKALGYLGSHSGRDENKVASVDFHPISVEAAVTFSEASITILCKKIYHQDLDINAIPSDAINRYYKEESPHRIYFGEIVKVFKD